MKKILFYVSIVFITQALVLTSCKKDSAVEKTIITISPGANAAQEAQEAFIEAEAETIIEFEEGVYSFTNTLSMDGKSNVIIRGAGRDKTFLDFSGQISGGEGVQISDGSSIRIENLTIRDSKGDAIKTRDIDKISFVNIATIWSGIPDEENGAYGLYPVLCTEVYIDNCYAYGASDAGIYVGQSDMVIVKNSVAEGNVAGIEIENTTNADVFDNEAFDNTGGVLVFDLPGLTQYGKNVRVFDNKIYNNNRTNFAPAGNIVGSVPAGTGFMLLSCQDVEFFNNTVEDNNFTSVLIASYLIFNSNPNDPLYDAIPADIYIHENTLAKGNAAVNPVQPDLIDDILGQLTNLGYDLPEIISDGIFFEQQPFCIQESSNPTFYNLNTILDDTLGSILTDITLYNCTKPAIPQVVFTPY